jgi:hypothetical protein
MDVNALIQNASVTLVAVAWKVAGAAALFYSHLGSRIPDLRIPDPGYFESQCKNHSGLLSQACPAGGG